MKDAGDIVRLDRAWYREDYSDRPRNERRLKREYLDEAQVAKDITTR